jgi:hypothetical protein
MHFSPGQPLSPGLLQEVQTSRHRCHLHRRRQVLPVHPLPPRFSSGQSRHYFLVHILLLIVRHGRLCTEVDCDSDPDKSLT